MPYYLVTARGDGARGAGLLAQHGLQNLGWTDGEIRALVSAESAEEAVERAGAALGEGYVVEEARPEHE